MRNFIALSFLAWNAAGIVTVHPQAVGAAVPAPVKPSCAVDRLASVDAPQPEWPLIAAEQGVAGSTIVFVDLSASGALDAATVHTSSGNAQLDTEALRVARAARFKPAVSHCRSEGGGYAFLVDFER